MALLGAGASFARGVVDILRGSDFGDFQIMFDGAGKLADGRTPYDAEAARDPAWRGSYIYPPFVASILAPISRVDGLRAARSYAAASLVLYLASFVLLLRTEAIAWRSPPFYLLAIAFLLFEPAQRTLIGAQHEFVFLWLFVLIQFALIHTPVRQSLMGVCIALGAIVKLYPALLLAYLLLQRWWTAILAFLLTFGSLTLVSILLAGWPVQRQFWWEIVPVLLHGSVWIENQAYFGFFSRLFVDGALEYPEPPLLPLASLLSTTASAFSLAVTLFVVWRRRDSKKMMAAFVPLMLLITRTAWIHYEMILLVPLGILIADLSRHPQRGRWVLLVVAAALVAFGYEVNMAHNPRWIFQSYKFIGVFLFWLSGLWSLEPAAMPPPQPGLSSLRTALQRRFDAPWASSEDRPRNRRRATRID